MISRRNFIKVSSLSGGGLALSIAFPASSATNTAGINVENAVESKIELNKFLSIAPNGQITIMLTKHEMGQGVKTAIPMILADELCADWSKVIIKNADYDKKYTFQEMGGTGGSGSVRHMWDAIRQAGATAREMLKLAAAEEWKISANTLRAENSFIINPVTNKRLDYGKLAETASKVTVPEKVRLKTAMEFVYIGKPLKSKQTAKVTRGESVYGIDVNIPGMLYASIEKCPVFNGKLVSFNAEKAKKVEGVIDVFPLPLTQDIKDIQHVQEGVVVIASSTWAAFKGREKLTVEWDYGEHGNNNATSFQNIIKKAKPNATEHFEIGDVDAEFNNKKNTVITADYYNPYQAHALMEPINATASVIGGKCEIWVGAQNGSKVNNDLAKVLGIPNDDITVHIMDSGGSFGRRYKVDSSIEAALASKKIATPVKLTWTREDEVMHDLYHRPQKNYFKAAISPQGTVTAVENIGVSPNGDSAGTGRWDQHYYFPNIRTQSSKINGMLAEGAWRSVGEHRAALSKECFIDELAHATSKDPLEFRIELIAKEVNLGDVDALPGWVKEHMLPVRGKVKERYASVLNFIKTKKYWEKAKANQHGVGLAINSFNDTVCAEIAEVELDDSEFGFSVKKVTAFIDCGLVVNPLHAKGQVEGAIIWALSALKYGGLEIEKGMVQRSNFHNNRVLRIDETPEIDVVFIPSQQAPAGLGEPGTPPLAPAVLNAYFNASGKRIRSMPLIKNQLATA